ncbi:MAG: PTS sugar transporter subunit IIA [Acidobacteria bacterium]|nr:PTS sugar transporter subunit IIA [Acidobacteriota bacterium]MCW5950582.1 PTS sugar transporter subunit IIA [Pyrinomonadaceae bacterium]
MSRTNKIGGVIVSHGQVANELLAAAETVVGEIDNIAAVSIGWHDDVELAQGEIERAIAAVSKGSGVLLATDMFGGTPTNIAAMFLEPGEIEIVTGVNLPMVIKIAAAQNGRSLDEFAAEVEEQGRSAITRAGELLAPQRAKRDA